MTTVILLLWIGCAGAVLRFLYNARRMSNPAPWWDAD